MPDVPAMSVLSWWPPDDNEPIGDERVGELVAYIRERAPAALVAAREKLGYHPDVKWHAMAARQLAKQYMAPGMRGICIGSVTGPGPGGSSTTIGIAIQRNGRLAITYFESGAPVQRWIEV